MYGQTHLDDGWILFAPFDKLFKGELGVLVSVHILENFVHTLMGESCKRHTLHSSTSSQQWMTRHGLTFSGVSSSAGSLTISPVIL